MGGIGLIPARTVKAAAVVVAMFVPSSAAVADGLDLFVEACRWSGQNTRQIHCGEMRFTVEETDPGKVETTRTHRTSTLRESLVKTTDPKHREAIERAIKDMESDQPQAVPAVRESRVRFLFKYKPEGEYFLHDIEQVDAATKTSRGRLLSISRREPGKKYLTMTYDVDARTAVANVSGVTGYDGRSFGRIQGAAAAGCMLASRVPSSDPTTFDFDPAKVAEWKASVTEVAGKQGMTPLSSVGDAAYDGMARAATVATFRQAVNRVYIQEYQIDKDRGFVCPVVRFRDPKGIVLTEWVSSGYVKHPATGLWFPAKHTHAEYHPSGAIKRRLVYKVDTDALKINHQMADAEFSVDVPSTASVLDARRDGQVTLRVPQGGVRLSLEDDLKGMEGLGVIAPVSRTQRLDASNPLVRVAATFVGVVALLYVFWKGLSKAFPRGASAAVLLLAAGLAGGCDGRTGTHAPPGEPLGLVAEPAAIDLGNVRADTAAVDFSFTLANPGDDPVQVIDITAGCSCMPVESYPKVLQPRTRSVVRGQFKTAGRTGDTRAVLRVQFAAPRADLSIPIHANVVHDYWCDPQPSLVTVEGGGASGRIDVRVRNNPAVPIHASFDDPARATLTEASRVTDGELTTIRYTFCVRGPFNAYTTSLTAAFTPEAGQAPVLRKTVTCLAPDLKHVVDLDSPTADRRYMVPVGTVRPGEGVVVLVRSDRVPVSRIEVTAGTGCQTAAVPHAEPGFVAVRVSIPSQAPPGHGKYDFTVTDKELSRTLAEVSVHGCVTPN